MQIRKRVIVMVAAAIAVVLGLLLFPTNRSKPVPPLPSPNGYDDFVKAGRMLSRNAFKYRDMSLEELQTVVATHADTLQLTRTGLSRECRVPIDYSQRFSYEVYMYMPSHFSEVSSFANVANLLMAEGRLATLEGRTNDAVRILLDAISFGQESCRGGLMLDRWAGSRCEWEAATELQKLAPYLNAQKCRETIRTLEALAAKRQPAEEVLKDSQKWTRRSAGLRELKAVYQTKSLDSLKPDMTPALNHVYEFEFVVIKLRIDLAAHAYELEKAERPKSIAELVPDYLKAIPKAPHTGQNMIYQP